MEKNDMKNFKTFYLKWLQLVKLITKTSILSDHEIIIFLQIVLTEY